MNLTLYSKHFGIYGFRGSKEHRLGILSTPYQLRDYGQVNLSDSIYCSVGMSQRMLPWSLSSKESACNAGDTGSIPGSGRSPGVRNGNPTPVFLPGKFHGQRSLMGYSPWDHKAPDVTEHHHHHI